MKPAFYDSLDKIPPADQGDYKLVTEAGSPNFNKYVLDLDPQLPVAMKNVELLGEKTTRDTAQAAAIQAAVQPLNTQIHSLTTQLQAAQAQTGLPAGQIAVPADTLTLLNNYKTLGEFDAVKTKVDEHGTLKEKDEAQTRKSIFAEVAKANGLDEEVFAELAEPAKLHELIESREIADAKGVKTKHWFVKGKDDKGADTSVAVTDFVKSDPKFKKFEKALFLTEGDKKNRVAIPNQQHGAPPSDKPVGQTYVNKMYKRPDEKKAE
jgi:hypothetical protein